LARRRGDVVVTAAPEDALFRSVAALREMGARITRYDPEACTLEARVRGCLPAVIRLAATPEPAGARLVVESETGPRLDFGVSARRVRWLLAALARMPG
jgi:hypothetical protein